MINSTPQQVLNHKNRLSGILEPVRLELETLEKKLIEGLSCNNPILDKITRYIISSGGKKLRPAVCFLIAKALNNGIVSSNHFQLGQAIELIHTATLIHDDVIDNADTRRNSETINKIWDEKTAVIAGDYLLAKALNKLASIKNLAVIEIFANMMSEICVGEIQQNFLENQFISLDQYIEKSRRKTAMLFVVCAECAAMLTPNVDNQLINASREYALNFGIAFQIKDDILNFSTSNKSGKPMGDDLKNGILTAPVIFALEEQKDDLRLKNLIQKGLQTEGDLNLAIELVLNSNGIKKATNLAEKYADIAVSNLNIMNDSLYKNALKDLAYFSAQREF